MGLRDFKEFCRRLGGSVKYKGRRPESSVEEAVCYLPSDVSIVAITKDMNGRVVVGFTRGAGVMETELDGVEELIAYDVEKVALDGRDSIEFSERPNRISAEIYIDGRIRLFVD